MSETTQLLATVPIPVAEFDPEGKTYNFPTTVKVWILVDRTTGETIFDAEDDEGAVELDPDGILYQLIREVLEENQP